MLKKVLNSTKVINFVKSDITGSANYGTQFELRLVYTFVSWLGFEDAVIQTSKVTHVVI